MLGVLINVLMILFTANKAYAQSGVLGRHDFIINEIGAHEQTAVNETLHKWQGISAVSVVGAYLIIAIEVSQYHIIPKRSFASDADFNHFVTIVKDYHHNHI